jgi:aminoglycoside phosphotransferase (APT) family kinase protein
VTTDEVPLEGGVANRGLVVRVGDTVRRPQRGTASATHALLGHLESCGFDGAPRFLGIDEKGREVLTYVEGEAVTPPYPAWALSDAALRSVAHLLRRYHDAMVTFDPSPHRWPPSPPAPYAGPLVSHNDPNLDNVIFRQDRAVAFIDFDLASPGSAVWDVAAAARLWSPLTADSEIDDARRGRSLSRFKTFVDSYGAGELDGERLVDAVVLNHDWLYSIIRSGAENGNQGFQDYWQEAAARVVRTRGWYGVNRQALVEALVG